MRKHSASHTKPLHDALGDLVRSLGIDRKLREYEAVTRWEEIVGDAIARVSKAAGIEKGVLIVRVNNGPWRNELSLMKESIIRKINAALGEAIVRDIRFL